MQDDAGVVQLSALLLAVPALVAEVRRLRAAEERVRTELIAAGQKVHAAVDDADSGVEYAHARGRMYGLDLALRIIWGLE